MPIPSLTGFKNHSKPHGPSSSSLRPYRPAASPTPPLMVHNRKCFRAALRLVAVQQAILYQLEDLVHTGQDNSPAHASGYHGRGGRCALFAPSRFAYQSTSHAPGEARGSRAAPAMRSAPRLLGSRPAAAAAAALAAALPLLAPAVVAVALLLALPPILPASPHTRVTTTPDSWRR